MDLPNMQSGPRPSSVQPRKYELPEQAGKAGLMSRIAGSFLLSGVILMVKNLFFDADSANAAKPSSYEPEEIPEFEEQQSTTAEDYENPAHIETEESLPPVDHQISHSSSISQHASTFSPEQRPLEIILPKIGSSGGLPFLSSNDNEQPGPEVGSHISDLEPFIGSSARGSGQGAAQIDNDDDTGDSRKTDGDNRIPTVSGPVHLKNLLLNQIAILASAELLLNASDADGDELSIGSLVASSGKLETKGSGLWAFTPDAGDTSTVTFTYQVSDGVSGTSQTAFLDLLPLTQIAQTGTKGDDVIIGTSSDDVITSLGGRDTISGLQGQDTITSGEGDDRVLAGDGDDVIFGGQGDDRLFGDDGDDTMYGGDGNDVMFGGAGNDIIYGAAGSDTIFGQFGDDTIDAGEDEDHIEGGEGDDRIVAGTGNDIVDGQQGDDYFVATSLDGDDVYAGGDGTDTYDLSNATSGTSVNLELGVASGPDIGVDQLSSIEVVVGGAGADEITGSTADNTLTGGAGSDVVDGGAGRDIFIATRGDGDDDYLGDVGVDTYDLSATLADATVDLVNKTAVSSDIGNDTIAEIENVIGGAGDDILIADVQPNELTGGKGDDEFKFNSILDATTARGVRDYIKDFQIGDKIDLSGIDANKTLPGHQQFELIVDKLEIHKAGELSFRFADFRGEKGTIIEGHVSEENQLELQIVLNGEHKLTPLDFIGVT